MSDYIIPMRSRTEAELGSRAARSHGIRASVVSVDPSLTRSGCSYGLRVSSRDAADVIRILGARGISHGEMIGRGR